MLAVMFIAFPYVRIYCGQTPVVTHSSFWPQKYINNTIFVNTLSRTVILPEGSLPDGVDINEIADEWGRFNGVIVYRPRAGVPLPQQVSSKSADIGITELLEIQMKMMEDISGVNGALQGKLESNSMSGTLYNQQTQNSLTALADLLRSFDDFVMQATHADVANMLRFYTRDVIRDITGESVGNGFNQLNAKNVLKLTNQ